MLQENLGALFFPPGLCNTTVTELREVRVRVRACVPEGEGVRGGFGGVLSHSPYESAATQMKRVHPQSRTADMVEIQPVGVKSQLLRLVPTAAPQSNTNRTLSAAAVRLRTTELLYGFCLCPRVQS